MTQSGSTQERFWLDPAAACPIPPGWAPVDDEVTFLKMVVTDEPLLIRGSSLCLWAQAVARARGWLVRTVESPIRTLQAACPDLDDDMASHVVEQLGDRIWQLPVPPRPVDVLAALSGERFWLGSPGPDHAAEWLLWWLMRSPASVEQALARAAGHQWSAETGDPFLQRCYAVADLEDAETCLEEWLGLLPDAPRAGWPGVDLPATVHDRLMQRVRHRLARDGMPQHPPDEQRLWPSVKQPFAQEIFAFLRHHPDVITDRWLAWLERHLSAQKRAVLRRLRQPDDPGDPPADVPGVVAWFGERYLPWIRWAATQSDRPVIQRRRELGLRFGEWYLQTLPSLLAGSGEQERLAWIRAHRLKEDPEFATLLVVADGLAPDDIASLLRHLRNQVSDLKAVATDWTFCMLPSVTQFTKRTLTSQDVTRRLVDEHQAPASSRLKEVTKLLRHARAGDIVAWVLTEPDRTYHYTYDESVMVSAIDARLVEIAGHLKTILEQTPPEVKLQVVVTSDHGRLLGPSRRSVPVPEGLQPHGRAAWGTGLNGAHLTEAYRIEGNVVWLNPAVYELPAEARYAVILDDQAFVTADGKGGSELSTHGGLFPEEVMVPWVVLRRNVRVEPLRVMITGEGIVGRLGEIRLEIMNPNGFGVELVTLSLHPGGGDSRPIEMPLNASVGALSSEALTRPLAPWPHTERDGPVRATLVYRLPDGAFVDVPGVAHLKSRELYQKDDILSELL